MYHWDFSVKSYAHPHPHPNPGNGRTLREGSTYFSSKFSFRALLSGLLSVGATIVLLLEVVPVAKDKRVPVSWRGQ